MLPAASGRPFRAPPHCRTAAHLVSVHAGIRDLVLATMADVDQRHIHDELGGGVPTVAEQIGHLVQSSDFFGRQILQWRLGLRGVLGRPSSGDADEAEGVQAAAGLDFAALSARLDSGLGTMQDALEGLTDAHLERWVTDVKTGLVPVVTFILGTVLGHAHGHAHELTETLRGPR